MQFQLTIIFSLLFTSFAFAASDKSVEELFKKYDLVMEQKKVELVDQVFTKKFLFDNGGKEDFIAKVKSLPAEKSPLKTKVQWRKGTKDEIFFAKLTPEDKSKKLPEGEGPEFIIIKEDGQLKIHGTLSDD